MIGDSTDLLSNAAQSADASPEILVQSWEPRILDEGDALAGAEDEMIVEAEKGRRHDVGPLGFRSRLETMIGVWRLTCGSPLPPFQGGSTFETLSGGTSLRDEPPANFLDPIRGRAESP